MELLTTDWLDKWGKYTPHKMFLREHQRNLEWSFSEFNRIVSHLAKHLEDRYGLKKGARIALYSKNCAEYVALFLASIRAGFILVPLNFRLTPNELNILIHDSDPDIIFHGEEYEEQVKKLSVDAHTEINSFNEITQFLITKPTVIPEYPITVFPELTPVMILYTAGTTGISKGVIITHKMLFWNSVNTGLRLDLNSLDHTQSFAPFFHTGGWNVLFTPFLHHGASHTILTHFDADLILRLMEKEKTTILFGVPTMLQMMADSEYFSKTDLSSVRYAIVGGAPMPIPLINIWHKKGIAIRQGYGLTEVGPNCFSLHQDDAGRKRGSIGFPNFYIEAKIVNEANDELGNNSVGELLLKSPVVTPGYWGKEKETKACFTGDWFHTGDMSIRDDEGYYYIVDRKKNMFISGGENVYPAEIERFFYTIPEIKEVAVIGIPDDKWGEVGKAYIVFNDGVSLSKEDLINRTKSNLAKYKIPKEYIFLNVLPKNEAGKIDKRELLKLHLKTKQNPNQSIN